MRFLSIDYGDKRIGVAISDPTGTIARELDVIENNQDFFEKFERFLIEYEVTEVIIGKPLSVKTGESTEQTGKVENFSEKLLTRFSFVKLHWMDERFTSSIIHESFRGDAKKPKHIDGMSAALILQGFLDRRN